MPAVRHLPEFKDNTRFLLALVAAVAVVFAISVVVTRLDHEIWFSAALTALSLPVAAMLALDRRALNRVRPYANCRFQVDAILTMFVLLPVSCSFGDAVAGTHSWPFVSMLVGYVLVGPWRDRKIDAWIAARADAGESRNSV